jgi:hypothetical protein
LYYSKLKIDNQDRLFEDIYTDIQRYKGLVDVLIKYDIEFAETESDIFNNYLRSFRHFYGDSEPEPEPSENTKVDSSENSELQPEENDSLN